MSTQEEDSSSTHSSRHQQEESDARDDIRNPPNSNDDDDDSVLHNMEVSLYQLDFEQGPTAAGGEVLAAGDHVYTWCAPGYQHHGIVLQIVDKTVVIAEFTNAALTTTPLWQSASHTSAAVSTGVDGAFRYVHEQRPAAWHKVRYQASPLECLTWRPGTCAADTPSAPHTVLCRVQFLSTCRHLIPDYHVLASNCEAVAVWCKTGRYTSAQVRVLDYGKATVTGVGTALLSPAAGLLLGGLSVWHSMGTQQKCQATTAILNREFAVYNMGKSPLLSHKNFVEDGIVAGDEQEESQRT